MGNEREREKKIEICVKFRQKVIQMRIFGYLAELISITHEFYLIHSLSLFS